MTLTDTTHLPPPETRDLRIGYMRLTDAAPLILAKESGLFEHYGLNVSLHREVSWANMRDRLVVGDLEAAQMLAPLLLATNLGVSGVSGNLLTGLSLGVNGNAITLSNRLWESMDIPPTGATPDSLITARALARQIGTGRPRLTFATVHMFSMHTFLLRIWLQAAGIEADSIRLLVLPPEQMCDNLARNAIDGFCVGAPWNTVAIEQGIGTVAATGHQIWPHAPEKVLAVSGQWHNANPSTHLRARLAIMEACRRLTQPEQRVEIASIMSQSRYLDLPITFLQPSLTGNFRFSKQHPLTSVPGFHVFWEHAATFPWRSHAEWIVRQTSDMLGTTLPEDRIEALVQQCYRTDLYQEAAGWLKEPVPDQDKRTKNTPASLVLLQTGASDPQSGTGS